MERGEILTLPLNLTEITIRGYASQFKYIGRQYEVHRKAGTLEVKRVR